MVGNRNHPLNESHYDEFTLEEYVLGQLLPDDEHAIRQHLAVCSSCRAQVAEIELFCQRIKTELEKELDQAEPTPRLRFDPIAKGWHKPPPRLSLSFRLRQFAPNVPFVVMVVLLVIACMVLLPGADSTAMRSLSVARHYEGPPAAVAAVSDDGLVLIALSDGRSQVMRHLPDIVTPRRLRFSPDANWIAFQQGNSLNIVEARSSGAYYRVAVQESAVWAWSPDSRALAYTDGGGQLVLFEVTSQTNRVLVPASESAWGMPVWTADSQHIAYAAEHGIWQVTPASGYRVQLARNPRPEELLLAPADWIDQDQAVLVWDVNTAKLDQPAPLYRIDVEAHHVDRVPGQTVAQGTRLAWPVNAFDSTLIYSQNQVWIVGLSEPQQVALPAELPWPQAINWSANGAWLAYAAQGKAEGEGLFLFAPQDGTIRTFELPAGAVEKAVFWADAEHLFVIRQASGSTTCELWLVPLTTNDPPRRILTNVPLPETGADEGWRWEDVLGVQPLSQ